MTDEQTKAEPDEDFDCSAGDAPPHEIEYLFAHTASGITIEDGGRISLNSVSPTTLFFSDRPDRVTGHITTEDFIAQWGEGDDSFAVDPPNAVLSLFEDEYVNDVVVVLREPVLSDGDDLPGADFTGTDPVRCDARGATVDDVTWDPDHARPLDVELADTQS
jgi:hypothetical protein